MMDNSISPEENKPEEKGFMSHLLELRDRMMRMVLVVLLLFLALFGFSEEIFTFLPMEKDGVYIQNSWLQKWVCIPHLMNVLDN